MRREEEEGRGERPARSMISYPDRQLKIEPSMAALRELSLRSSGCRLCMLS